MLKEKLQKKQTEQKTNWERFLKNLPDKNDTTISVNQSKKRLSISPTSYENMNFALTDFDIKSEKN